MLVVGAERGGAQTALRLCGQALAAAGGGVPASIELEAVYGVRGLDFVGQKTLATRSNDNGQWSALGLASAAMLLGAWDPASKEPWPTRESGGSPKLSRAVGAAIAELQRIAVPQDGNFACPGFGC